jgi:hypothetical protein
MTAGQAAGRASWVPAIEWFALGYVRGEVVAMLDRSGRADAIGRGRTHRRLEGAFDVLADCR